MLTFFYFRLNISFNTFASHTEVDLQETGKQDYFRIVIFLPLFLVKYNVYGKYLNKMGIF